MTEYKSPTAYQCDRNVIVEETERQKVYATWYPSMGGYVAKCLVFINKNDPDACIDLLVWHDGEFPFDESSMPGAQPAHLHHCCPEQFIEFGRLINKLRGSPEC